MTIDQNIFRESLTQGFIALIDSERGVATKLAKAIGKDTSFISQVKRGRPVNSLHLKAVGIVYGPQKVLELLELEDNATRKNGYRPESNAAGNESLQEIIQDHITIIKRFKNPKVGRDANLYLVDIQDKDHYLFEKAVNILKKLWATANLITDINPEDHPEPNMENMDRFQEWANKPNSKGREGGKEGGKTGTKGE